MKLTGIHKWILPEIYSRSSKFDTFFQFRPRTFSFSPPNTNVSSHHDYINISCDCIDHRSSVSAPTSCGGKLSTTRMIMSN